MTRALTVTCLLLAGIWLLTSPGWALLAAGCLVFAVWPDGADTALARGWRRAVALSRAAAAKVAAGPRRAGAAGSMASGIVLVPAGLGRSAWPWIGVTAAGLLLIGFSLLTGQGA